MVVVKGLSDIRHQRIHWAVDQGRAASASLTEVEMVLVKYRYMTVVRCGGLWLPGLFLVPVHSSVAVTGLTPTEMSTGRRTPWKNPTYIVHEVCT